MIRTASMVNGWKLKIYETNDFRGIVTDKKVVLIGLNDIDVYGIFDITEKGLSRRDAFYNIAYEVNKEQKIISLSFRESR